MDGLFVQQEIVFEKLYWKQVNRAEWYRITIAQVRYEMKLIWRKLFLAIMKLCSCCNV